MKSIAVFLILNILLLSSFMSTANSHHDKVSCCLTKTQKDCCKQQKHNSDNGCAKGNCNAMLSCGTCGFMITASVSILPTISTLSNRSVPPSAIGELSDYHANDWNPPKA